MSSILNDTKQALGLALDYDVFDFEIKLHINSVLADLNQLGVGPEKGLQIETAQDDWDEVHFDDSRLNSVKSYMYLRVRMLFDPPSTGYMIEAYQKMIEKAEFRITVAQDDISHPLNPPSDEVIVPDDEIIIPDDPVVEGEV